MISNLQKVTFNFYGTDFAGKREWPAPRDVVDWLQNHYRYSLADHPQDQYELTVTMIAGARLVDRIAFDLLYLSGANDASVNQGNVSAIFQKNTELERRFEIQMPNLDGESVWNVYQLERNIALDGFGTESHAEKRRLQQDAQMLHRHLADILDKRLGSHGLKNYFEGHAGYPTASSMLLTVFMDYKDDIYYRDVAPAHGLKLVHPA